MYTTLATLIDRFDDPAVSATEVIRWSCPVPSFGDISHSRVATLGLNPSNREFVDESGKELEGNSRRFHTLNSLGLSSWREADFRHLNLILKSCKTYFAHNPYDSWFKKLDKVVSGACASYYDGEHSACHLDLVPYATARKWTTLSGKHKTALLSVCSDVLARLLRDSPIHLLILNGTGVVKCFQHSSGVSLRRLEMRNWSLRRKEQTSVTGIAFQGTIHKISGLELEKEVRVLGFNHNIQSSFGVTSTVIHSIRMWIQNSLNEKEA